MKRSMTGIFALGMWAAVTLPASAAWDNVFQPTLFERWRQPTTVAQYYVPPVVVAASSPCDTCAPAPCPQPCSTSYTQRCYYQPVTTYQTKTYYEPVTTYRTSYYYEPVVSYRYSAYYDPCTCGYQQVAVPQTSYLLRAKECPVQSWAARCVQEPVTSYQKSCYWQPQTTCCTTTQGAPIPITPGPVVPAPVGPPAITPVPNEPPSISGSRTPGTGMSKPSMWEQQYPPLEKSPLPSMPGTSFQPPVKPAAPPLVLPPPPVKIERIAVNSNSRVDGQVVLGDNSPRANAKLLFVNAGSGERQTIYTNTAGRFNVELPAGSWHVYLHGADGILVHHARVDVNGAQTRQVNLVSRSN